MTADSAVYIMMADAFSPYGTTDHGLYGFLVKNYPFPPLFPVLLAISGGGSDTPLPGYLASSCILLLTLVVYYRWNDLVLKSRTGSLLLIILFALMPNTLNQLTVVQSEHLYLLFVLTGFFLLQRDKSDRDYYLAGLVFGLASITRTIGLLAILAYLPGAWARYSKQKFILLASMVSAPVLLWGIYKYLHGASSGYLEILFTGLEGNVVENIVSQAGVNLQLMWLYWVRCFDVTISDYSGYAIALATLFICSGFLIRLIKREADALYMAGYLFVLLIWPYPAQFERFFYVLMPFALTYGFYALNSFPVFMSRVMRQASSYAYIMIIVLVMLPTIAGMWGRFHYDNGAMADQVRSIEWLQSQDMSKTKEKQAFMRRVYEFMSRTKAHVPEGACVTSTVPAYLMLHSGRKSKKPPNYESSDMVFNDSLQGCDHVLMIAAVPRPNVGNPPMYPYQRIKDNMRVLDVIYTDPGNSESYVAAMLARYEP